MRRLFFVVIAALMLAVSGCSSSPSAGSTPSPTQPTASASATTPMPEATPSPAAPYATCLNGRYQLVRFVGLGTRRTYGTGEGGDVTITFDNGSYLLHGAGQDPIKVTLAGQTVDLLVNGTLSGDYRVAGNQVTFTAGESTGAATLSIGPLKESVTMEEIGSVLASNGAAGFACANDALIITLQDLRLEFGRV